MKTKSGRIEAALADVAKRLESLTRERGQLIAAQESAALGESAAPDTRKLRELTLDLEDAGELKARLEARLEEARAAEAEEARAALTDEAAEAAKAGVRDAIRGMEGALKGITLLQEAHAALTAPRDSWRNLVRRLPNSGDLLITAPSTILAPDALPLPGELEELAYRVERRLAELREFDSKAYRAQLAQLAGRKPGDDAAPEIGGAPVVAYDDPERIRRVDEYATRAREIRERPCLEVTLQDGAEMRARNEELRKTHAAAQDRAFAVLKAEYIDLFPEEER